MEKEALEFYQYIDEKKAAMRREITALENDGRRDEACVCRASLNIYDIMAVLFRTAKNKANGEAEVFKEEFRKLATKVPSNWKASLEKASAHEDYGKVMLEEAKLKAADEVIAKFDSLFGEVK